ncbi:MAG TPA: acyl-CoA synthetase FdrA [Burkholderiaceae bacterium]|nr:acyl-CoA synthetase FdrA [Burkholderiaceae bacterium]
MAGTRFRVFANLYKDSVTLMQLAQKLRERDGIEQASCLMATPANLAQLEQAELSVDAAASPNDLLVVVRGVADACEAALGAADALLKDSGSADSGGQAAFTLPLTSLALGVAQADGADLALISVPGDYAAAEAMKALALGLHVMLFSDNVPLAEERAVKHVARDKGLLVMGPDCGTAIVNGVPLGFANVVRRGDIGLVAASGTGLQEVTCRIHHLGSGVSQALGTGGRDLKEEIGGITMLQGLQALAADAATRVIVLISKPPAPDIARRIEAAAAQAGKPVVVHFLGAAPRAMPTPLVAATSLRQAADLAVALARGDAARGTAVEPPAAALATVDERCAAMAPTQHAVRALFTGGTFCYEAQLAFNARGLPCRSNAPTHVSLPFDGRFDGHVMLDLGDDDYTRGRPHPMIDPSVRDAMVRAQGADANTAAILFDVVLGYGAHADPAQSLAAALSDAQAQARTQGRTLALIGHVCGTEGDPQDRAAQMCTLREVGAVLVDSNIEAALLAAHCAQRCTTRRARG